MKEIKKAIVRAMDKMQEPYTVGMNAFNIHHFNNPDWVDDELKPLTPTIPAVRKAYFKSLEPLLADDWDKIIFVELTFDELLFVMLHSYSTLYNEAQSYDTLGITGYPFFASGDFINRHSNVLGSHICDLVGAKLGGKYFLLTKEWFVANEINRLADKFPGIVSAFEDWCSSKTSIFYLDVEVWIASYVSLR